MRCVPRTRAASRRVAHLHRTRSDVFALRAIIDLLLGDHMCALSMLSAEHPGKQAEKWRHKPQCLPVVHSCESFASRTAPQRQAKRLGLSRKLGGQSSCQVIAPSEPCFTRSDSR